VKVLNRDDKTEHTDPVALFAYLNDIGGKHGIGRLDMVEDRFVGIKSRGYVSLSPLLKFPKLDLTSWQYL
jgi:argininosuccinate synthase